MTRQQITAMIIFLKEAFVQIDNARTIAAQAQEARQIAILQRDVSYHITRLEGLKQDAS